MYPFGFRVPITSVKMAIPTPDRSNPAIAGQNDLQIQSLAEGERSDFPLQRTYQTTVKL